MVVLIFREELDPPSIILLQDLVQKIKLSFNINPKDFTVTKESLKSSF